MLLCLSYFFSVETSPHDAKCPFPVLQGAVVGRGHTTKPGFKTSALQLQHSQSFSHQKVE